MLYYASLVILGQNSWMTGVFCSSVINRESARVSESGQNGIITRWRQMSWRLLCYCCTIAIKPFFATTEISDKILELLPHASKVLFLDVSVIIFCYFACLFICLSLKYLGNGWTDLRQIYSEDVFGPSLRRVWMPRSKDKGQGHQGQKRKTAESYPLTIHGKARRAM